MISLTADFLYPREFVGSVTPKISCEGTVNAKTNAAQVDALTFCGVHLSRKDRFCHLLSFQNCQSEDAGYRCTIGLVSDRSVMIDFNDQLLIHVTLCQNHLKIYSQMFLSTMITNECLCVDLDGGVLPEALFN